MLYAKQDNEQLQADDMSLIDPTKVLWKEVDGKVIVLLISTGYFIELNNIGSVIWKLLAENKTTDEIANTMIKSYDVTKEKLSSDIKTFIAQMTEQGLLKG